MIARESRQRRWNERDVEAAQRQAVDAGDAARYAGLGLSSPRRYSPGHEGSIPNGDDYSDDYGVPGGTT